MKGLLAIADSGMRNTKATCIFLQRHAKSFVFVSSSILLFCYFSDPRVVLAYDQSDVIGSLSINLNTVVDGNAPFEFQIWLQPKDPTFRETVTVTMDTTPRIRYDPQVLSLVVGERKTVRAAILKSNSGLAVIWATAPGWDPVNVEVDSGFSAKTKLKTNLTGPIQANKVTPLIITFVDDKEQPVRLDGAVKLILKSSNIEILDNKNNWSNDALLEIDQGVSSTLNINIKSVSWMADTDVISAEVMSYSGPVYNTNFSISILPRWYVPMLMAMLGGLLYSSYQVLRNFSQNNDPAPKFLLKVALPALASGILAGLLAYLLARWDILGIKADTTSLQGFVILGLLFSYVGIDWVLKAITRRSRSGTRARGN